MSKRLTFNRLPNLDLVLVGTVHTLDTRTDKQDKKEFLKELSDWSKLALEGNECENRLYRLIRSRTGRESYELLAEEGGPKPPTYLERDADWHALTIKYGMKREVFEALDALSAIQIFLRSSNTMSDEEIFATRGRYESEVGGTLNTLPNALLNHNLRRILSTESVELNDLTNASNMYTLWYAGIRDYELLGPRSLEFYKHNGRKGILCGQTHIANLLKFLTTGKIEVPLIWEAFKKSQRVGNWLDSTEKIERLVG